MPDDCDPRQYLETPARIIAENDTHVALAVRVEKASIAHYLPLVAALADLTPTATMDLISAKLA